MLLYFLLQCFYIYYNHLLQNFFTFINLLNNFNYQPQYLISKMVVTIVVAMVIIIYFLTYNKLLI